LRGLALFGDFFTTSGQRAAPSFQILFLRKVPRELKTIINPKFTTSEGKLIEKKEDIEIKK
jgi:hypothetical protein